MRKRLVIEPGSVVGLNFLFVCAPWTEVKPERDESTFKCSTCCFVVGFCQVQNSPELREDKTVLPS